jgi:hypothetical protein
LAVECHAVAPTPVFCEIFAFSKKFAVFSGRFIWPAVREANPGFAFDPVEINTLKAKGITFEATFSGFGKLPRPVSEPPV